MKIRYPPSGSFPKYPVSPSDGLSSSVRTAFKVDVKYAVSMAAFSEEIRHFSFARMSSQSVEIKLAIRLFEIYLLSSVYFSFCLSPLQLLYHPVSLFVLPFAPFFAGKFLCLC